jgi:type IV secretory pathway TrbF-like protein
MLRTVLCLILISFSSHVFAEDVKSTTILQYFSDTHADVHAANQEMKALARKYSNDQIVIMRASVVDELDTSLELFITTIQRYKIGDIVVTEQTTDAEVGYLVARRVTSFQDYLDVAQHYNLAKSKMIAVESLDAMIKQFQQQNEQNNERQL